MPLFHFRTSSPVPLLLTAEPHSTWVNWKMPCQACAVPYQAFTLQQGSVTWLDAAACGQCGRQESEPLLHKGLAYGLAGDLLTEGRRASAVGEAWLMASGVDPLAAVLLRGELLRELATLTGALPSSEEGSP